MIKPDCIPILMTRLCVCCRHGYVILQAIKRHARIGKPMIITETGIADGIDTRRELWATTYLKAVSVRNSGI